jgi:serine/threonine-protein kinase
MLAALLRAQKITPEAFEERRMAWLQSWLAVLMPRFVPFAWIHGYAAITETPAQAAAAESALASLTPIPRYAPRTLASADVGRVLLLAGHVDEALKWLEPAASSCFAIDHPIAHTRAQLSLGLARERASDVAGACEAYSRVLARWGKSKPRSVSADRARERMRVLKCH